MREYLLLMSTTAAHLGVDTGRFQEDFRDIVQFELGLLEIMRELQNPDHPPLPWSRGLVAHFKFLSPEVKSEEAQIIFQKIFEFAKCSDPTVVANFFGWRAVLSFLPHLDDESRALSNWYSRLVLKSQPPSVEHQCILLNQLADIRSSMFLKFGFQNGDKLEVEDMAAKIWDSFEKNIIDNTAWLGEASKSRAKQVLRNTTRIIGYNDKYLSKEAMDCYFEALDISESYHYFGNIERIDVFHKSTEKPEWISYSPTYVVNAFNNDSEVVIPAGIIGGAFFNRRTPEFLNVAGLGAVIGHEITHSFKDGHVPGFGRFRTIKFTFI